MRVREIRMHLEALSGSDVSPDPISAVTNPVLEEVAAWQNRPLDAYYPRVFFAAIRAKIRDAGSLHLIRHSMNFASWKDRKPVARALQAVCRAQDAEAAAIALEAFEESPWGAKHPAIGPALAAEPGSGHPVLRLPRERAPDHLYHECHRGVERQAAPGGPRRRALPR